MGKITGSRDGRIFYIDDDKVSIDGKIYYEKENANSGYPLLADVLAEIDKELRAFGIVLDPDDLPRKIIKGVLSKYFS